MCRGVLVEVSGPPIDDMLSRHSEYERAVIRGSTYLDNPVDVHTLGVRAVIVRSMSRVARPFTPAPAVTIANAGGCPKRRLLGSSADFRHHADDPELFGLGVAVGEGETFRSQAAPQDLADGRRAARHPFLKAPIVQSGEFRAGQHDLQSFAA
jgi:hypothetical protein